ncbi:MAG: DUF494 family protein [Halanaerobium sp.]|nr:DUF494 family protein [Halanaerobium sp.]
MNKQVVEIINYLIKEIINQGDLGLDASRMIEVLLDMGYRAEDIDAAFELIFYSEEIIDLPSDRPEKGSFRVFSPLEKLVVTPEIQGILLRLQHKKLLYRDEEDQVIQHILSAPFFPVSREDLGFYLAAVIEDEERLREIVEDIPVLGRSIFTRDQDYLH